ncbi:HEPN domain-containing protein [Sphingomonas sp. LB2R24]|uniref:hypothetical protein n=1 Tax=Sphingomonas sorbitolis TaxID=3096165 RepID=UPI002FC65CD8
MRSGSIDNQRFSIAIDMLQRGMTRREYKLSNVKKAEFVFTKMIYFQRTLNGGNFHREPEDVFCDIMHPDGSGSHLTIGREAYLLLNELAETGLNYTALSGRATVEAAQQALGPILVQRVMIDRRRPTEELINNAFEEMAHALKPSLADRTYFLPCHLTDTPDPDRINIGPVTFLNRTAFRKTMLEGLKELRGSVKDLTDWDRKTYAQAARYYRGFQWIASITIKQCDQKSAEGYAHNAVTAALSCLQLMLGADATRDMAVGGNPRQWNRTADLRLNERGALDVTLHHTFHGGANFEKGWSKELEHPGMQLGLKICGIVVESALPCERRPLSLRMLSAIQWFGEAARERSPATRFIKLITAVEHIVLTGEPDVTRQVSRRVAALIYDIGSKASRQQTEEDFKRLYNIRSRLIHGGISPWDASIKRDARAAATMAELVAHSVLSAWQEVGLYSLRANPKRMRKWFDHIVWMMVQDTEPVDHVVRWRITMGTNELIED